MPIRSTRPVPISVLTGTQWHRDGVCEDTHVLQRLTRSVFSRFAAGSAVATVSSQLTFLLLFGVLGASAAVAGTLALLAGAVPNFVIQRFWTWQRTGRVGLRSEVLPYLAVIAFSGLVAVGATSGLDRLIAGTVQHHGVRTIVLAVAFAASYVLLFVLKFALLDRLVFRTARVAPDSGGPPASVRVA